MVAAVRFVGRRWYPAHMSNIGPTEIILLLLVALLLFGAKRLPEIGKSLGTGMREFKDSVSGVKESVDVKSTTTTTQLPVPTPAEVPAAPAPVPTPAQPHEHDSSV
jgi:sec-independent protein translocase protein TatA